MVEGFMQQDLRGKFFSLSFSSQTKIEKFCYPTQFFMAHNMVTSHSISVKAVHVHVGLTILHGLPYPFHLKLEQIKQAGSPN